MHRWIVSPGEGADKVISYRQMTYLRIMLSAQPMCSEWLWSPTPPQTTSPASAFIFIYTQILIDQTLSRLITPFGQFLPALQVAVAYRWARLHPTASVHVYVVNVPAPWYPWVFLALDFMVSGPTQAAVGFTGMLGAHLHLF